MTYYKIVQTHDGPSVAHLTTDGLDTELVEPKDEQVRADKFRTEYIENNQPMGWGPVDGRTEYRIGEVTEADELNRDESAVSAAGLHAFTNRQDALDWMESAEI